MIKMLTAFTEEIDDVDAAVSEILAQLDIDNAGLKNSLGIVHCYSEFPESGVVKALHEKLAFDLVGSTTFSLSVPGFISQTGLTLTVLTSDTVSFVTGVSTPVTDTVDEPLEAFYKDFAAGFSQKPALLLPFVPFMMTVGGDEFIEKINSLAGGIPAFGTLAISNEPDYSKSYTIYNGGYYPASLVLAALIGDADPLFFSVSVTDNNILKQKAVVTGSRRNVLQTINDMPAVKYLESLGLARNGEVGGLESMPFIVYLADGSRLIRACMGVTEEDGGAILGGAVPVGSALALATMELEDVVDSTGNTVSAALEKAKGRGMLIYSCAARYWVQGVQITAEQEKVAACIGNTTPYHFIYSAGEIFPEFLSDNKIVNHLQNDSLIICIL